MQADPQAHASQQQQQQAAAAHAAAQAQAAHAAQAQAQAHAHAHAQAQAQVQQAHAHADAMRRRASSGAPSGQTSGLGVNVMGLSQHGGPMSSNGNVPSVQLSPVAPVTPIMSAGPGLPRQTPGGPQLDLTALFPRGAGGGMQTPTPTPNTALPTTNLDGISQQELERHQRSANGPTPDDPYWDVRLNALFPVQGARPGRRMQAVPPEAGMSEKARAMAAGVPQQQQQQQQQQSQQQPPGSSGSQTATTPLGSAHAPSPAAREEDPVRPFLDGLASAAESPQRQQMWSDLIRLKTKALELQIAEARAKERAAELELHRLQSGVTRITGSNSAQASNGQAASASFQPPATPVTATAPLGATPTQQQPYGQYNSFPLVNPARSPVIEASQNAFNDTMLASMSRPMPPPVLHSGNTNSGQHTVTAFDLEAMLQENSLDNLFSWLPDGDGNAHLIPQTAAPSDLLVNNDMMNVANATGLRMSMDTNMNGDSNRELSPPIKRPLSPSSESSPPDPPPKKGKPRGEKKIVIEQHGSCQNCGKAVARVLLRAPKTSIPIPISVEFRCPDCTGVYQPPTLDPHGAAGSNIGSTEARKRMRTAMEDDDLVNEEPGSRRCFCDVCQRVVACGQIVGGPERSPLGNMAEIICASCDSKYQRCTDCGGGGGPRVGIGKWRLKQVFQPGRKTCSLSHSRLGDRPREIGVHVTPTDFTPEQLKEVISRCKNLWTEKTLSRLAVPEMLEIDLPPGLVNPLRNYADIDDVVTRCWPSREAMIRADGVDRGRFKRLLGLTWAHSRPRRTVRTVDIEEEYARNADTGDDPGMSTVLANVKRTNVVIPAGSELIGMWGGEWDMIHGSLLVSTLIPFEGTDGEDTSALSVGELITKVQQLHLEMNKERQAEARRIGREADLVRACEHLWVVSGGSMPLIRERMADILVRKRSFVHVEEYLTRHPDFLEALKARPVGLHPDIHRPMPHQMSVDDKDFQQPQPLILVRWLGKDFDAQRILEIKQKEFGGGKIKGKIKKMPKSKV